MIDVAGGDPALSRHLRHCLKVLRDHTDNPEFRELADDIMAGRRSLRQAFTSPIFAQALNPQVAQFAQRYEQLSADEREWLAAEGQRQFAEQREQLARERRAAEAQTRGCDDSGDDEDFSQQSWLR
ncbi:MAG: hypothetical protein ACRDTD_01975 [Pseudonocardiaceae bacterium]